MKEYIKTSKELGFYEFSRIIGNIEAMWRTTQKLSDCGVSLDGRQFHDLSTDMLLMLADLLNDKDNLLPYFCWAKDFGKIDDELTLEGLWNILTENK